MNYLIKKKKKSKKKRKKEKRKLDIQKILTRNILDLCPILKDGYPKCRKKNIKQKINWHIKELLKKLKNKKIKIHD